MDTDTDLNILTYFRCIAHSRSRLGPGCKSHPVRGGRRLGQERMRACSAGPYNGTAELTHVGKQLQLPFGKVTLDEVSVYRSYLQATILAISPEVRISLKSHANRRFSLKGGLL